jgi:hypothetical protein
MVVGGGRSRSRSGNFKIDLFHLVDANMLTQKQSSKVINGVKTEVVLQPFADRILILITQLGKVGNLVRL